MAFITTHTVLPTAAMLLPIQSATAGTHPAVLTSVGAEKPAPLPTAT
ncbi:MAG: hypothetical protein IPI41_04510 [Flavobacteriales bacterium]|nr:hypothetical protein [Flavobacteriales bacterium]